MRVLPGFVPTSLFPPDSFILTMKTLHIVAIMGSFFLFSIFPILGNAYDGKIESVFNSKNGTGLVALKTHEEVNIIFTSSELSTRLDSDGYVYFGINEGNKLITDSENFTANELPKTFTFSFIPQNTGIFSFTKGIWFNSDNSYRTESQGVIVLEKFSKAMAFNGQCKKPFPEFTLIIRPDFSTGACVKMDTASVLKERGWH